MTEKSNQPKTGIKPFTKAFWALSRPRQEAFLKNLYHLSPQNKALFKMRLGDDAAGVITELKKGIAKETTGRIGKFKKLRLSKINEHLRNANKYALSMHQQIELKRAAWSGMLDFITSRRGLPDRYQVATARQLDTYLQMVKDHILETSEVEDIMEQERAALLELFAQGHYLPEVEEIYIKWFVKP